MHSSTLTNLPTDLSDSIGMDSSLTIKEHFNDASETQTEANGLEGVLESRRNDLQVAYEETCRLRHRGYIPKVKSRERIHAALQQKCVEEKAANRTKHNTQTLECRQDVHRLSAFGEDFWRTKRTMRTLDLTGLLFC